MVTNHKKVERLLNDQISSGIANTVTVANQIVQFSDLKVLTGKMNLYLFPKSSNKPYSLARFMVLCSVLNSEDIRKDVAVKKKVIETVRDPYFLRWLDIQYNIN
jgi:hypothetical protein